MRSIKLGIECKIFGIYNNTNIILGDFHNGGLFSVNKIQQQLDLKNMDQYLLHVCNNKHIHDLRIDGDGNLWLLHGIGPVCLTKHVPVQNDH
jgi:hypothetical protein